MKTAFKIFSFLAVIFLIITINLIQPIDQLIHKINENISNKLVLDIENRPLNISYQNKFNVFNNIPIEKIPEDIKKFLIFSEDKRFYSHSGVDWIAKLNSLYFNLKTARARKGASTISEQVVRIVYRRDRNLWSKWIEVFEAILLERSLSKNEILEFYINQVPFSNNRRGFLQASRFYFNRDLNNLSLREILFLVINLRSPSYFNVKKRSIEEINSKIDNLAYKMKKLKVISELEFLSIKNDFLVFEESDSLVDSKHFLLNLKKRESSSDLSILKTNLNLELQDYVNKILKSTLSYFNKQNFNVKNAGCLVLNHKNMTINSYNSISLNSEYDGDIDAVLALRQPASTIKPFLYSLAIDNGFSLSSTVNDEPMSQPIFLGKHDFFNASHRFYGEISLSEALSNSLNIPALKLINKISVEKFFNILNNLGFKNIKNSPDYYNVGLAIGTIETNLFELVRAYAVLSNSGIYRDISFTRNNKNQELKKIFSSESTSLITAVLSDRISRRMEFSRDSILNFPLKTAVKTGTSSDYKDAWAFGYNDDFVVGVWFGNFDYQSMNQMAGALGPGFILRNVFNELNKLKESKIPILDTKNQGKNLFYVRNLNEMEYQKKNYLSIIYPFNNSEFAFDPHIDPHHQKLFFNKNLSENIKNSEWIIDNKVLENDFVKLKPGKYILNLRGKNLDDNLLQDKIVFFCH